MAKAFTTNTAGQILKQTVPNAAYIYAGPPNSGTTNFTVDGLNQALSGSGVEAANYAWDANGNLATETPQGSGAIAYAYDGAGRLTARGTAVLSYDPLGRLFALTPQGSAATRFAYDYGEIIGEFSAANALLVRYVKGAGADETLVSYAGAGTSSRTFLQADERGSIIARTDNTGTPLGANTYDAYGRPGASNAGRFQYTGQAWIAELGLYYYKARFYHPKLGRFIQTDPIGYAAGLNLYAYVGGDPVGNVDPSGREIVVVTERRRGGSSAGPRGEAILGSRFRLPNPSVRQMNHALSKAEDDDTDSPECDANPSTCGVVVTGHRPWGLSVGPQVQLASLDPWPPLGPGFDDLFVPMDWIPEELIEKTVKCAEEELGGVSTFAGSAAVALGWPIPGLKQFTSKGAISGTSIASLIGRGMLGNVRFPFGVPTLVGGPGTGSPFKIRQTTSVGGVLARGIPWVGWALLGVDAINMTSCMAK